MLGRSQPAISQASRACRKIYGGDRFVRRRGAALALMPIGEAILPSAQIVIANGILDSESMMKWRDASERMGPVTTLPARIPKNQCPFK